MPDPQVNVPAVGKVDRKWVFAGLAAVSGIVVYAYWRRSQAPEEELPGEGDQYATGDDYTPDAYIGATQPGGETYDPNATETNVPTTNQEWSQRAIDALESVGYTRDKAATTIGKYLAGQPLDLAEKLIIQVAIAMMGNPPAGALPIISAPSTPVTPAPTPTPGTPAKPVTRIVWRGHRLTANTTWLTLAKRYAGVPSNPNSVEATKRSIMLRNPTIMARIGKQSNAVLQRGWIVLVPLRQAA